MKKASVLLLIIVLLLASSFVGIGVPRASALTAPTVTLSTYQAGAAATYTIQFATAQALSPSQQIMITLPPGTTVPEGTLTSWVTVNSSSQNVTLTGAAGSTGSATVVITVSAAVAAGAVTVRIDVAAGIKNPPTAQSYTLQAYTSIETTPVTSAAYTIVNLPRTLIIVSPATADGLSNYYKTRPTVVLSANSPVDSNPVIYYSVNSGAQQIYSSPIQVPDGNITLTYYARDSVGNQEDANTLNLKVKTTLPQITILSPAEGSLGSTHDVTLTGRMEGGSSVTVNGIAATVLPTGEFSAGVSLREGPNAIQVIATDVAGNVSQTRVNVTLDTKPPVLTMTSPKIYSTVMTEQVAVSGKTEAGATVTVAGAKVNVAADGSFSIMYMFPKEGLNVVDLTSTDAAGNVAKTGIPVTYVARTLIRLQVGNRTAMINDATKTLQATPINVKGVVMIPLRFIGEAFGATVEWEPVFKIVRLQLASTTIYLQVGYNYASVNGKKIILQGLPSIIMGTTMVPIRFISEAFNAQVVWNAPTQGIEITHPKP